MRAGQPEGEGVVASAASVEALPRAIRPTASAAAWIWPTSALKPGVIRRQCLAWEASKFFKMDLRRAGVAVRDCGAGETAMMNKEKRAFLSVMLRLPH